MIKLIADLHTHTNVSHHAYSSLEEMVQGAKRADLRAIAITNHGPSMVDGAHYWHFTNLDIVPRKINGVCVLRGIEMNIMPDGSVDPIDEKYLKKLDYVIASFHEPCFPSSDVQSHTKALESILRNPYITTFGHLGNQNFAFDQEKIISQCNKFGKIVEINNNSLAIRKGSKENCRSIAKLCMKYNVPVVVTSDAHISFMVGKTDSALNMLNDIDFPENLIINANFDRLNDYFKKIKNIDLNSFEEDKP